ncbi:flagellar assembly protein FliH [Paraglaciecola sp. MB-3u-78]|uniref:flagellar assembly protein FliH n=1 Tax=Paraglaciecola sp. MB-3u-78 TaxID=2058332 RepID=UPI000C3341DD|nr:flagellar assembly protein FliH [Paraglaciecola sp. MB-3u-78]PKH00804.1 flagellar assembly protein FliH [Paraglaciecola sp. MB-3u-78]
MTTDEQDDEFQAWDLPYVEDINQDAVNNKTNAFNRKSDWKYEPPEEEIEILPPTAEEIEAIREAAHAEGFSQGQQEGHAQGTEVGLVKGHEEGFEKGLEEGTTQGLANGEEQVQQYLTSWISLIDSIQNPVANVEKALEKELVLLAVSLAKGVIRSEVKTNPDLIFQALSEGLKALPIQEKNYQIHLHPDDIELVNNHFSSEEITKHRWDFIESPELSAGGCEIVTQSNAVDITVERRVKDIINKFLLEQGLSHISESDE